MYRVLTITAADHAEGRQYFEKEQGIAAPNPAAAEAEARRNHAEAVGVPLSLVEVAAGETFKLDD